MTFNRDKMLDTAAAVMAEKYTPELHRKPLPEWLNIATKMYRERFATGLAVVEEEIRLDASRIERDRILAWLRQAQADHAEVFGGESSSALIGYLADRIEEGERRVCAD